MYVGLCIHSDKSPTIVKAQICAELFAWARICSLVEVCVALCRFVQICADLFGWARICSNGAAPNRYRFSRSKSLGLIDASRLSVTYVQHLIGTGRCGHVLPDRRTVHWTRSVNINVSRGGNPVPHNR